jgi:hypothetical protein
MDDNLESVIADAIRAGLSTDAELEAVARQWEQSQSAPKADAPSDDAGIETISLGKTVKNIPRSALNVVRDTVRGVGGLMTGLADDPVGTATSIVPGIIDHYSSRYGSHGARGRTVQEDPVGMVMDLLPVAGALKAAPAVGRATLRGARTVAAETAGLAAKNPIKVSMGLGAAPGIISGNPMAAALGAGYGFERAPILGRRFAALEKQLRGGPTRQAAAAKSAAAAATSPDAVLAAEQSAAASAAPAAGARRQIPAMMDPPSGAAAPMSGAAPASSGRAASTSREALLKEMLAREPDWRTTDAVPIDAMKPDALGRAKTIIEPGESRIGLGELLARLVRETPANAAEMDRIARAINQRVRIDARPGKGNR